MGGCDCGKPNNWISLEDQPESKRLEWVVGFYALSMAIMAVSPLSLDLIGKKPFMTLDQFLAIHGFEIITALSLALFAGWRFVKDSDYCPLIVSSFTALFCFGSFAYTCCELDKNQTGEHILSICLMMDAIASAVFFALYVFCRFQYVSKLLYLFNNNYVHYYALYSDSGDRPSKKFLMCNSPLAEFVYPDWGRILANAHSIALMKERDALYSIKILLSVTFFVFHESHLKVYMDYLYNGEEKGLVLLPKIGNGMLLPKLDFSVFQKNQGGILATKQNAVVKRLIDELNNLDEYS